MSNVPRGFYTAVAVPIEIDGLETWAQFGASKNKGTKQVVLNMEIVEGDYAGSRLAWFGYFTQDSADRTIEALRLVGFKGDDLATLPTQKLGQRVSIVVEEEEYDGKVRSKIAWINRLGGGGMKLERTMDANELRLFAAQLKARVRSKPEVAGEAAAPAPRGSAPDPKRPDDDSIPF